jgi:hypothetical protein
MKKRDNNMTPIDHDDEVWVVLVEDNDDLEDSDDFDEDNDDLK